MLKKSGKRIITFDVTGAVKGGVGKTRTIRQCVETALALGISTQAIQIDQENKDGSTSLGLLYPGVGIDNVSHIDDGEITAQSRQGIYAHFGRLVKDAREGKPGPEYVLLDLGAGQIKKFLGVLFDEGILDEIVDGGHRIRILTPVENAGESYVGLADIARLVAPDGKYGEYGITGSIVLDAAKGVDASGAQNRRHDVAPAIDFPDWLASGERKEIVGKMNWTEMSLPVLRSHSAYSRWIAFCKQKPTTYRAFSDLVMVQDYPDNDFHFERDVKAIKRWYTRFIEALQPHVSAASNAPTE